MIQTFQRVIHSGQLMNILIVGLLFSLSVNYFIEVSYITDLIRLIFKDGHSGVKLVIGVLSSSEDFARRKSIRSTWKSMEFQSVRTLFVTGDSPCRIDPYWRIRESRCSPWQVFVPVNTNENEILKLYRVQPSRVRPGEPYFGIGFQIKFPIVVQSLGISKRFTDQLGKIGFHNKANLTLSLEGAFEDRRGEYMHNGIISRVNFTLDSINNSVSDDGFIYFKVKGEEMSLSRLFEGYIRLVGNSETQLRFFRNASKSCSIIWNKLFGDDGIVAFRALSDERGKFIPFTTDSCPLVSFLYQVPDLYELRNVINTRATQNKCHVNKNENLASKIVEEIEDYDDILFIQDTIESKENFPSISLQFFEKILRDIPDFDYILLTNDKTFLAIDQIISRLQTASEFMTWRSNFQKFSPVTRFGPYPDLNYISDSYPLRPSPSGSVLSKDLVQILVSLKATLRPFGDVSSSLAVWLAPFNMEYKEDPDFIYGNYSACKTSTAAYGPFEPRGMSHAWTNYLKCNRICSCSA